MRDPKTTGTYYPLVGPARIRAIKRCLKKYAKKGGLSFVPGVCSPEGQAILRDPVARREFRL